MEQVKTMSGPLAISVNDEPKTTSAGSLGGLLEELGLHERRCATMVNGEIVRRPDRGATALREGDKIEIIAMVGGG